MENHKAIVVLTGAGISAESGIRTFRAADGLWEDHRIEDVASPAGFERDPTLVQRFYNERRAQLLSGVSPNAAHEALARLELAFEGEVLLVTQNIDDLHERAGSRNVVHMHGELLKVRCTRSGRIFPRRQPVAADEGCSCCDPPCTLRPHVVWFGETPLELDRIFDTLDRCGLFVAVGTSGNVYPAAGFVEEAYRRGAHTVELNLEPSAVHTLFAERSYGPATQIVPAFVERLLQETA